MKENLFGNFLKKHNLINQKAQEFSIQCLKNNFIPCRKKN